MPFPAFWALRLLVKFVLTVLVFRAMWLDLVSDEMTWLAGNDVWLDNSAVFDLYLVVIQALVALVQDPEPEHPLRADLAEEYTKDRKKFMKNAEEHTKKHAEKRPSD